MAYGVIDKTLELQIADIVQRTLDDLRRAFAVYILMRERQD